MKFIEEPRYKFWPDVQNNLSLPEKQRLTVEIIRPTGYQRAEFTTTVATREFYPDDQPLDADGKERKVKAVKSFRVEAKIDADYILRNCVGTITNCSVDRIIDDKGKTESRDITTGAELAECRAYGFEALVSAIVAEVQSDTITDSKKKTFA